MEEKKRIGVKIDHKDEGFYTDNVTVFHNPKKFVVDFSQTTPRFDNVNGKVQQTFVVKHKTLIMEPTFAKIVLKTLEKNIEKYEKDFGKIGLPKRPKKSKKKVAESATRYIG